MGEYEEMNLAAEAAENMETVSTEEMAGQEEQIENQSEEPVVKTYTQEELNQIVGRRVARERERTRKEFEQKYGELESVLKAGTGKEDLSEVTKEFRQHYEGRGVKIPNRTPGYSARDIEVLADAEAKEIISGGWDEVVEETNHLSEKGVANMTAREKALFSQLANYRKETETGMELAKIGVTEDVYNSKEFKDFAGKFDSKTPITEIYGIYNKMQPKKEVETMGSMKSNVEQDNGIKDFYTYEESLKYTKKDFDENPKLYKAIIKSMQQWCRKK